jgi:capsular exopolysaccharide synthesis family protein
MSEIFDFLKKTENKKGTAFSKEIDLPVVEITNSDLATEGTEVQGIGTEGSERIAPEIEICKADEFDLNQASLQIKNILDPLTLVGEQFRVLRSKLGLMQKQRGKKVILITSSVPDEGKTFAASGLAGVFAQEPGKRVLLIDADMRKPKSGSALGLNDSNGAAGLSKVLCGEMGFREGLLLSKNPAFYFMPSGPLPLNPSELLSSHNMEKTLKSAAANFDWVIIDSPPALALSDTSLIAPLCDAVILVVRAGSTPSKLILNTIDQIGRDRICGVILNRLKQVHSSRYYYQYYYCRSSKQ